MAYFNNSDKDFINAQLTEETRKLKIAYCKIGKLYADTCTEPSGDFAQLINAVRESQNNIRSLRKQLADTEKTKLASVFLFIEYSLGISSDTSVTGIGHIKRIIEVALFFSKKKTVSIVVDVVEEVE